MYRAAFSHDPAKPLFRTDLPPLCQPWCRPQVLIRGYFFTLAPSPCHGTLVDPAGTTLSRCAKVGALWLALHNILSSHFVVDAGTSEEPIMTIHFAEDSLGILFTGFTPHTRCKHHLQSFRVPPNSSVRCPGVTNVDCPSIGRTHPHHILKMNKQALRWHLMCRSVVMTR